MPDTEHYIAVVASTELRTAPFVPEISLHIADNAYDVWAITSTGRPDDVETPVPYWSFPWPGGLALARHVLDNPELVRGRRVLDLASGSGLVAIAAALAGAAVSVANDIDDFAAAAQDLNARANNVDVETLTADLLGAPSDPSDPLNDPSDPSDPSDPPSDPSDPPSDPSDAASTSFDVVLAGDVCYEREFSRRILAFLRRAAARGAVVLLADPGRSYVPTEGVRHVSTYEVPATLALESSTTKRTTIWQPLG